MSDACVNIDTPTGQNNTSNLVAVATSLGDRKDALGQVRKILNKSFIN